MKIIKHTFEIPNVEVINGELQITGSKKETYTFTLLFKGLGLFEDLAGKPLLSYLMDVDTEDKSDKLKMLLSKDFIPKLACASYIKIEGDRFHNNRATAEEFRHTAAYQKVTEDIEFMNKLVEMAVDCVSNDEKSKANAKGKVTSSKK